MFTGIIEELGTVKELTEEGGNLRIRIRCSFSSELQVDQSIAVNGVCLTVEERDEESFSVSAIQETLEKSSLGGLSEGAKLNLERAMPANGRFDGHIVQGHVDSTASCISIEEKDGSHLFRFELDRPHEGLIVPKGSITVDGVSLTVVDPEERSFGVAIIPYTYEHTRFGELKEEDVVNVEFDVLGKYVMGQVKIVGSWQ